MPPGVPPPASPPGLALSCRGCLHDRPPTPSLEPGAFAGPGRAVRGRQRRDRLRQGGAAGPAEMELLDRWLDAVVYKVDCTGPRDPGRVTIRRLNRAEYNTTVRDLLSVDFQPARDFPADDVGYGFDNVGDVLSLPPLLMEK